MKRVSFREQRELNYVEYRSRVKMAAIKNNKVPTDEAYYVSAADLADKIIGHMQRGCDPLRLGRFTRILVRTNRPIVAN
jgi:hypothetical protein